MPIYWQLSRQRVPPLVRTLLVNDVCRPKVVCPQLLKRGKSTELGRASTNCGFCAVVRGDRKGKRVEKWAAHCHFLWHQRAQPSVPNPHTKALLGSNFQCDEEPRLRRGVGFRGLPARADLSSAYCEGAQNAGYKKLNWDLRQRKHEFWALELNWERIKSHKNGGILHIFNLLLKRWLFLFCSLADLNLQD